MFVLTFVLILFLFLIYKRHQHMSTFKRLGIPGPRPNFIFGHSFDIVREGMNGVFPKWTQKYGPIVGFFLGGRPQVLVTDFELIRQVMIKDFHIFSDKSQCIPGGIHPAPQLQKALVWRKYKDWRPMRATLSPSFSSYKLNAMEPSMMLTIENLDHKLNGKAKSGQEFNLTPLISDASFSTAMKCIFGIDLSFKQLSNEHKYFIDATRPQFHKSILAMALVLFPSLECVVYPLRRLWEQFRMYMLWSPEGVCYNIAKKIVLTRRQSKFESVDFLQLLMNSKRMQTVSDIDLEMSSEDAKPNSLSKDTQSENLFEEEILSNAMVFLLASYETVSVTVQFTLQNLLQNQNVQEKLRDELRKVVEKGSVSINYASLSKVPLLLHVVKETLRMFPPAMPFTTRVANEDYEYKGIVIPKGIPLFIGVSSIHNDPMFWPEPEVFRPERFESDFDKLAFLPFGGGPRNCIGMRFAYMEVQLLLANILLKYRFEPGPSSETKIQTMETFATLVPKNGVFCKVTRLE